MIYQQKCFPPFPGFSSGSVLSYGTELWSPIRFSDFIPINPLDFTVNCWDPLKSVYATTREETARLLKKAYQFFFVLLFIFFGMH